MICREIKCKDYLTDDGEPAWCFRAGQPAEVAAQKCPKVMGKQEGGNNESSRCHRPEQIHH
jgi:hypothetical protein